MAWHWGYSQSKSGTTHAGALIDLQTIAAGRKSFKLVNYHANHPPFFAAIESVPRSNHRCWVSVEDKESAEIIMLTLVHIEWPFTMEMGWFARNLDPHKCGVFIFLLLLPLAGRQSIFHEEEPLLNSFFVPPLHNVVTLSSCLRETKILCNINGCYFLLFAVSFPSLIITTISGWMFCKSQAPPCLFASLPVRPPACLPHCRGSFG